MLICEQLKNLRCSLNLSQDRFGNKIGISGKSVSAYETGRCIPPMRVLTQIANTFNVNFAQMSNYNRTCLNQRIQELEKSLQVLKDELEKILTTEITENK